jgi:hypothetical protein
MAQFAYNSADIDITKVLSFYINYGYKLEAYRELISGLEV